MIYVEVNKIEQKGSSRGEIRASVELHKHVFSKSDGSDELMPDQLQQCVSDIVRDRITGPNGALMGYGYSLNNYNAFKTMYMGGYYMFTEEELKALAMKAFSDKIMEKVLDEATKK